MNVVLAAQEAAGLQMLRALARSNHRLVAVLATHPEPGDTAASIWAVARASGFQTWPAKMVKDPNLADRLRSERVDILLNVHSLYIIHKDVLAAPRLGAFNLHPGPLPRYAGLNAVSWAIYRGEKTHGVTIHKMEPGIDTGPIVYQSFFPVEDSATALSLSFKCVREGVKLMLRLLEVASTEPDRIPLLAQDLKQREYFGSEVPNDGRLSWSSPACKVLKFVQACDYLPFRSPWGYPRTQLSGREISVVKIKATGLPCNALPGTVAHSRNSGVHVACLDEWVLVKQLQIENKYADAADVLRPGDRLGSETYCPELPPSGTACQTLNTRT
jgi:methionyl-tRNA formyltransferase